MTSASKAKGNSFERRVADFLTATYGEKFIRAPGSGAYVGGKNVFRKATLHEAQIRNFKSDIVPGESFPHMNAECKSYKDFPFHQLYSGDCKILNGWLDQMMDVADPGDFNMLMMKFNRKGEYVVTSKNVTVCPSEQNHMIYNSPKHGQWVIQEFDAFWKHNQENVKELCK
jgi:Holliday junction resolvase